MGLLHWGSEDDELFNNSEEEEYEVEDYYTEVKRFSELSKEEIDRVAEKNRKISPKFKDLFRPEVGGSQEDIEYEQEVERIAARSENVYAVMPLREDQAEQENATNKESKEEMNDSKKEKRSRRCPKNFTTRQTYLQKKVKIVRIKARPKEESQGNSQC